MGKSGGRGLLVEAGMLLVVFSAGFFSGRAVAGLTGSRWWGLAAGAAISVGICLVVIRLVNRLVPTAPGTTPTATPASPGAIDLFGFLFLFLTGDLAGILVAGWTGSVWWGLLAGAAVVTLLLVALFRLASWAKKAPAPTEEPSAAGAELTWAEPRAFRSDDLEESRRWVLLMVGLTIAATLVFLSLAILLAPGTDAPRRLLLTGGGIVVLFLGLFGFTRLMRIVVRITNEAILLELGEHPQIFRFAEIDHCEIGTAVASGRTWPVLVAILRNGDREMFCLDASVTTDRLRAALERRGVTVAAATDLIRDEPEP